MKNKSVSDFVAASMDAVLKSKEHKSLFGTQYKFASSEECKEHGKVDDCDANDLELSDDKGQYHPWSEHPVSTHPSAVKPQSPVVKMPEDKIYGNRPKAMDIKNTDWMRQTVSGPTPSVDKASADDDTLVMPTVEYDEDDKQLHPEADPEMASTAFDIAIDSLLTASAALDSVGMPKSSSLSLKLASLVVEAKKKDVKDKKDPEAAKAAKAKEKAKLQAEKEKAKEKADKEKAKLEAAKKKEKEAKDTQMAKDKSAKDKAKEKAEKDKLKEKADKLKALEKKKSK